MRKSLIVVLIFTFLATSFVPMPPAAASVVLPEPGTMVSLSPAFEPVLIKGLKVHPENPFRFDFIVDTGSPDSLPLVGRAREGDLKEQSSKLIKYFLASLTIPEKDLWVNLSPYEKDRMIADNLGQTQMGQDMLAQDYILKQLTASLIYPEKDLGKAFWDKVYAKAQQMYGTTEIPVNTFNKVWIVADKADVFERGNVAYIVGAHLKVMLEEDYTAFEKNQTPTRGHVAEASASAGDRNVSPSTLPNDAALNMKATQRDAPNALASQIIRDVILPAIEEEINQGKNFAPLRQMFYSMILASWYKMALKDALLTQLYGNQSKMKGLEVFPSPGGRGEGSGTGIDDIYQQYLKAYKKGVFNYIKEDPSTDSGQASTPRKYFSGGVHMGIDRAMRTFKSELPVGTNITPVGKMALVSGISVIPNRSKLTSTDEAMQSTAPAVTEPQWNEMIDKIDMTPDTYLALKRLNINTMNDLRAWFPGKSKSMNAEFLTKYRVNPDIVLEVDEILVPPDFFLSPLYLGQESWAIQENRHLQEEQPTNIPLADQIRAIQIILKDGLKINTEARHPSALMLSFYDGSNSTLYHLANRIAREFNLNVYRKGSTVGVKANRFLTRMYDHIFRILPIYQYLGSAIRRWLEEQEKILSEQLQTQEGAGVERRAKLRSTERQAQEAAKAKEYLAQDLARDNLRREGFVKDLVSLRAEQSKAAQSSTPNDARLQALGEKYLPSFKRIGNDQYYLAKYISENLAGVPFEPTVDDFINEAVSAGQKSFNEDDFIELEARVDKEARHLLKIFVSGYVNRNFLDIFNRTLGGKRGDALYHRSASLFSNLRRIIKESGELSDGAFLLSDEYVRGQIDQRYPEIWELVEKVRETAEVALYSEEARVFAETLLDGTDLDRGVENAVLEQLIEYALGTLKPREEKVVKMRFGVLGEDEKFLEQAGKVMRVTRERVRQLEVKGLRKLSHPSRSSQLKPFVHAYDEQELWLLHQSGLKKVQAMAQARMGRTAITDFREIWRERPLTAKDEGRLLASISGWERLSKPQLQILPYVLQRQTTEQIVKAIGKDHFRESHNSIAEEKEQALKTLRFLFTLGVLREFGSQGQVIEALIRLTSKPAQPNDQAMTADETAMLQALKETFLYQKYFIGTGFAFVEINVINKGKSEGGFIQRPTQGKQVMVYQLNINLSLLSKPKKLNVFFNTQLAKKIQGWNAKTMAKDIRTNYSRSQTALAPTVKMPHSSKDRQRSKEPSRKAVLNVIQRVRETLGTKEKDFPIRLLKEPYEDHSSGLAIFPLEGIRPRQRKILWSLLGTPKTTFVDQDGFVTVFYTDEVNGLDDLRKLAKLYIAKMDKAMAGQVLAVTPDSPISELKLRPANLERKLIELGIFTIKELTDKSVEELKQLQVGYFGNGRIGDIRRALWGHDFYFKGEMPPEGTLENRLGTAGDNKVTWKSVLGLVDKLSGKTVQIPLDVFEEIERLFPPEKERWGSKDGEVWFLPYINREGRRKNPQDIGIDTEGRHLTGYYANRLYLSQPLLIRLITDVLERDPSLGRELFTALDNGTMTLEDKAMAAEGVAGTGKDSALTTTGGIDFNSAKMQMNTHKEGQGVQMSFDPALLKRIKSEGFEGLDFQIQAIVPITNLPRLLGISQIPRRR